MHSSSSCVSSSANEDKKFGRFTFGAFAFVGILAATGVSGQPRPFTLDDMAAFRSISDAAVSPDGRQVVFAVRSTILAENRTQTDLWTAAHRRVS